MKQFKVDCDKDLIHNKKRLDNDGHAGQRRSDFCVAFTMSLCNKC